MSCACAALQYKSELHTSAAIATIGLTVVIIALNMFVSSFFSGFDLLHQSNPVYLCHLFDLRNLYFQCKLFLTSNVLFVVSGNLNTLLFLFCAALCQNIADTLP
jgi:hypothetical protein